MAQVDGDALIQRDWLPEQLIDLPLSPFGVLDVVAPGDDAESVDQVVVDNGQRVGNVALDNSPGVGDTESDIDRAAEEVGVTTRWQRRAVQLGSAAVIAEIDFIPGAVPCHHLL